MNDYSQPFAPSKQKFFQKPWSSVGDPPTTVSFGKDVSAYTSVLISAHPSNPLIAAAPAGWTCTLKVWRFMREADNGNIQGSGQWYAKEILSCALDGDTEAGGDMMHRVPTLQSEKMYVEVVATDNHPATYSITIGMTVLGLRTEPAQDSCTFSATSSSHSDITVSTLDKLCDNGSLYSTVKESTWAAAYVNATTVSVLAGAAPLVIAEEDIVAVTRKVPGDETEMDIWIRGGNLDWDYAVGTGYITLDGVTLAATDILEVYWEGPEKGIGITGAAPILMDTIKYLEMPGALSAAVLPAPATATHLVQLLSDLYGRLMSASFQLASQSDRTEEVNPLNDKYVTELFSEDDIDAISTSYWPSAAGASMDSYKDLDFHLYVKGGLNGENQANIAVYLDVSSGMLIGGVRYWDDVSLAGYVLDADQTVRELAETALINVTGNVAASRVVDFDELNIKYFRLRYVVTLFAPTTANAEFHVGARRKAH